MKFCLNAVHERQRFGTGNENRNSTIKILRKTFAAHGMYLAGLLSPSLFSKDYYFTNLDGEWNLDIRFFFACFVI